MLLPPLATPASWKAARCIREAASVDEAMWVHDLPQPIADAAALAVEDRAAFDLICISTATSLLHELRHVRYVQEGDRPEDRCEEERLCDGTARQFLLERASDYAGMAGVPLAKVLSKPHGPRADCLHHSRGNPAGRRSGFGDPSFECGPV
jgi:hypothetical protein